MRRVFHLIQATFRALRRNLVRSALTCLGITIGISAVIVMSEIGEGTAHDIQQAIAKLGTNVVQIDPSESVKAAVSTGSGGKATLTPSDGDAILSECTVVKWVAPSIDMHAQIIFENRNWAPHSVLGTTPDYLLIRNWNDFEQGTSFTIEDVRQAACVCLIGRTPAKELFGDESPVGHEVRINNVQLVVVGVLSKKGATMTGADQDDFLIVPWTTMKYRLSGVRQVTTPAPAAAGQQINSLANLYPSRPPAMYAQKSALQVADYPQLVRFADLDDIFVSVNSADALPIAIDQIRSLLRARHRLEVGAPDDFRIRNLTEISEAMGSTSKLMGSLLLCVSLISLFVGGVGIMNIMLVSVTERTREIGVRMAVGARASDIRWQFLNEAILLCVIGGIAGVLLGRGVSTLVRTTLGWPTISSPAIMIAAVVVSGGVGIIFGYYPAWKASRLDPIEALRYE